jgi:hypothetical protein
MLETVILATFDVFCSFVKSIHSLSVKMGERRDLSPRKKREIEVMLKNTPTKACGIAAARLNLKVLVE